MFHQCEVFANEKLLPIVAKMNEQIHLISIKKSMISLVPVFIIGSLSLIPQGLLFLLGTNHSFSIWIIAHLDIISLIYGMSIGLVSLYATALIAYHLANEYKIDGLSSAVLAIFGFGIVSIQDMQNSLLNQTFLGSEGLFFAIISAIIAVEIYRWCLTKHISIQFPNSVPEFVSRSFDMVPICLIVIGVFLIARMASVWLLGAIPPVLFMKILLPIVGCFDNPFAYTCLKIFQCFLFFFGIHPAVLDPITKTISHQFLAENIMNYYTGLPATHFFCPGPESAFGNFTGTGITIGFVFWCLLSHRADLKKVGKTSIIPSLFGVNEPILFGAPIVMNPIFFIPYVIGGGLLSSLAGWAMSLGYMRCAFFTPPYFGIFLEAYLTNFDVMAIVVNAIQLILSIVIWYPFFKIYEKSYNGSGFNDLME